MVNESFKIIEMIQYGSSIILTRVKIIMTWFRLRIYQKKRWNDTLEFRVTIFDYLTLNHLNLHNRPRSYAYLTRYWANNAKHYAKNWQIRGRHFFQKGHLRSKKLKDISVTFDQFEVKRSFSSTPQRFEFFENSKFFEIFGFEFLNMKFEFSKWNNHFNKRSMLSHRLKPKRFYWN